jgi:uncharacterized protein (DUF885 family)
MSSSFPDPALRISRRGALIGGAAALALPRAAFAAESDVRAGLDGLAALPGTAARIEAIHALPPPSPGSSAAIDMVTVEQGLYVDTALEALRPSGKLPWTLAMPAGAEGIWQLPNGDAIYALLLGRQLGWTIEPEAAHHLLETEVARLQKRADQLLHTLGYKGATTGERLRTAFADPAFLYPDTDAGRDQAVADMNATLAAAKARVAQDFLAPSASILPRQGVCEVEHAPGMFQDRPGDDPTSHTPKATEGEDGACWQVFRNARSPSIASPSVNLRFAKIATSPWRGRIEEGRQIKMQLAPYTLNVTIERMSPAEEAAGKQGYRRLPEPGRPGAYVVDLRQIRRRPSWTLPAVVHHELLPGHMLQLPIEALARAHPLRLAYLPAFPEGWAVYAEHAMLEAGGLEAGGRLELGQIHWLLFRAMRGLIDTGIHHRRWSVTKARKTLEEVQGEPAYFADFASDIDHVIRDPGLRAAEALTWIRLHQLRAAAGSKAAEANFHRAVLANGRKRLDRLQSSV